MAALNAHALDPDLLADDPYTRRESEDVPTVAAWRCEGCKRGVLDGAVPDWRGGKLTPKGEERIAARWCTRCSGRLRNGSALPLDAPTAFPGRGVRGAPVTRRQRLRERADVRRYWEAKVFDAAMDLAEHETGEEHDAEFRAALVRFLATCAYAGRFLKVSDYVSGADVPTRPVCGSSMAHNPSKR